MQDTSRCQVVVSAYREDLSWMETGSFAPFAHKIIYSKHKDTSVHPRLPVIQLPNVGRCDHTYLYHIVNNYDQLADVTLFLTGSCQAYKPKRFVVESIILPRLGSSADYDCLGLMLWTSGSFCRYRYRAHLPVNDDPRATFVLANIRPFGAWWKSRFPNTDFPKTAVMAGNFAIRREAIRRVPKEVWQCLLDELSVGDNLEVGHFLERSWYGLVTSYR